MTGLPARIKAGYGTAAAGIFGIEILLRIYLIKFYTDVAGLSPRTVGIATGLALFLDAITDPLTGELSDNMRHPWGKRRVFILFGGILLAMAGMAVFSPPEGLGTSLTFLYLLLNYMLVNVMLTVVAVPHYALGGELTMDRNERTELYAWRLMFANLGMILASALPGLMLKGQTPADLRPQYIMMLAVIAALTVFTSWVTFRTTRGRDKPAEVVRKFQVREFLQGLKSVLRNKAFLPLILAYIISYIGVTANGSIALYYYQYRLGLRTGTVNGIIVLFIIVWTISLIGWIAASRRFGKRIAFWGVFLAGVGTCIAYPLAEPGSATIPYIFAVVGGLLVGSIVILDSIVADIVDYDELKTGLHREGIYFGFWKMSLKFSRGLALLFSGFALEAIGFVANQTQTPQTSWNLALLFGPGVGAFWILGALIFLAMPLTDAKHRQVQRILENRRRHGHH